MFAEKPLTVTSAGAIHDLPDSLIARAHAHITGTITYYDAPELLLFMQDVTGGVFVHIDHDYPFRTGQLISVDGAVEKGFRANVAPHASITLLGTGDALQAEDVDYASLVSGEVDCRLVNVTGIVRDAVIEYHPQTHLNALHMDLLMPEGEVGVYVKDFSDIEPTSLLGTVVRLRAVAGGIFDAKQQPTGVMLHVPGSKEITVLSRPRSSALNLPITKISDVFMTMRSVNASPRIHVRGSVAYYSSGESAVLEDQGQSLYVETRETKALAIGQVVDAYGFADNRSYSPSLRETVLIPTGETEEIKPVATNYQGALSGAFSDRLISLQGHLVSQLRTPGQETLTLNVDGHLIRGTIPAREHLRDIPVGSRIEMIGICRVVAGGPWRDPLYFSVASRSSSDIRVISPASWWTTQHLAVLLVVLLSAALAVALWAFLLRLRVTKQNGQITRSMEIARYRSLLLEQISDNLPLKQLLAELGSVVTKLVPGGDAEVQFAERPVDICIKTRKVSFRSGLEIEGKYIGEFVVYDDPCGTGQGSEEVIQMIRELIAVILRQTTMHRRLVHHSTHDPLTNLPNRRFCEDKINEAIEWASQQSRTLAVVYVDVDRFKEVNDQHGHQVGDLYLQALSKRLSMLLRADDMLARIGGDEFIILLPGAESKEGIRILERLRECFNLPFVFNEITIRGSASFGIAHYPEHGICREELEAHADGAMYIEKHFRGEDASAPLGLLTTQELKKALIADRFRLAYQPQFSSSGVLTGLEALVRLEDPVLGTILPGSFIAIAESTDFIVDLGDWILRKAVEQASEWQLVSQNSVVLAVNVSARQIEQPTFAGKVLSYLDEFKIPAQCLELELTERTLLSRNEMVFNQIDLLAHAGVKISLDDFGTSHSCLSLLHRLPISTVKIDQSFVRALRSEPRVLSVLEGIITMAKGLHLRVIAEGVEDADVIARMMTIGDTEFQGYWFSRPLPAEKITATFEAWSKGVDMTEVKNRGRSLRNDVTQQWILKAS